MPKPASRMDQYGGGLNSTQPNNLRLLTYPHVNYPASNRKLTIIMGRLAEMQRKLLEVYIYVLA